MRGIKIRSPQEVLFQTIRKKRLQKRAVKAVMRYRELRVRRGLAQWKNTR